jgi:hypothetical protein
MFSPSRYRSDNEYYQNEVYVILSGSRFHRDSPDGTATLGDLMRLQDSKLDLFCWTFVCLVGRIFFSEFISFLLTVSRLVLICF